MRLPRLLIVLGAASAVAFAAAACTKSTTPAAPSTTSACSVTLGSTTTSVSSAATTGTMSVTADATCAWTAQASASFITITSGSSGTGNGSVAYSIAANTGAARSASIVVNDKTVAFTQGAPVTLAPNGCTVTVDPVTKKANAGGDSVTVTVTASSTCSYTATSNSSFLTVPSTTTIGNGTVVVTVAQNTGAARTGTVTIGGQTVTISQDAGLSAGFNLFDPGQTSGPTTTCSFRSAPGGSTTCTLRSTSFTGGANSIVQYQWHVDYTNGDPKTIDSTTTTPSLNITDKCGSTQATDGGAFNPMNVTLTVTDSNGNTATAVSGKGGQPSLFIVMYNCGQ